MSTFNFPSVNLLQGLGKPTLRGIKKCSKCGVFNGTRRATCKNTQCGISLKSKDESLFDYDAVKLITGTVRQVYSVQVKEASTEYRGFVQLPPLKYCTEETLLSDVALCFVDSCQRSFDNSILTCHEEDEVKRKKNSSDMCSHISLALKSSAIAIVIQLNLDKLNKIKIPYEMKNKLRVLAIDSAGAPLVQRISKDIMAIKGQVNPKHPLGYFHFKFLKSRNKNYYDDFYCNCVEFLVSGSKNKKSQNIKYKCIHYYACIAALSTDLRYSEEFSLFLNNELNYRDIPIRMINLKSTKPIIDKKNWNKINIITNNRILKKGQLVKNNHQDHLKILKTSHDDVRHEKYSIKRCKKIAPKIYPIEIKILNDEGQIMKNPSDDLNWSFLEWMAFITESINSTMQFVNCGIVNTQVFYIPEIFYNAFKERIPKEYEEQKSNIGSTFFTIMNVNHVKEIFDTTKIKLRVAKKFVHNEVNGYVEYDDENSEINLAENPIQFHPSFIFFLNVGQSTVDESDNCNNAFIIEWLSNIFNISQIGQLKIQYKYGRKSV